MLSVLALASPPLTSASDQERHTLQTLLDSPHWAFRVFGLLRLEHYEPASVETIVLRKLADPDWQVRCFAHQQAAHLGIRPSAEELAAEEHPLVIRAILRHSAQLPAARLERGTSALLRSDDVEDFILGVEIAAACDVEALRREATQRLLAFIRGLDDQRAAMVARRLGRLLGVSNPAATAAGWQRWLAQQRGLTLPPPRGNANAPTPFVRSFTAGRSPVADMEPEVFARLREYLDALKQRDLDVAVVMDTTASMLPMINEARVGADELILFLSDIARQARLGFVAYRDHDNPPVVEVHPFTSDVASVRRYLFKLAVTGGADYPEAVYDGLRAAADLDWNPHAERQVILVGDAPPHERDTERVSGLLESAHRAGTSVHAVHVPMQRPEEFYAQAPPHVVADDRQRLEAYNADTRRTFEEIARLGGGRAAGLEDSAGLVPAIMHFSLAEPWWPVFDSFYAQYLDLCR